MNFIHDPYKGGVTLTGTNIVIVTKQGTEQYRFDEVSSVELNRRKANGTEISKGLVKGIWGGMAGALGGAIITLGAGAPSGAIIGATVAGAMELTPKTDFTIHFKNNEKRTWIFSDAKLEEIVKEINDKLNK